ncbi:hypothetical protein K449DRAFT_423795 [Hypoxylon sp. EC38]|nr:hypothetical protein K449DRAFT_423795 [Hypoxylon sp. EC38]
MPLNGELKSNSLYIALDARPFKDEYHWALVTTDNRCHATLRHASNLNGPWKREEMNFHPDQRMMLIALVRVGDIISDPNRMVERTRAVPADGVPSSRTGKEFNCLTWVLDTIVLLANEAVVTIPYDIGLYQNSTMYGNVKLTNFI